MKKTVALALVIPLLLVASPLGAKKFYDDDPLEKEPTPLHVENAKSRKLNDYYDFFLNTFAKPGERHAKEDRDGKAGLIPAQAVNTLGEVPDSAWFTNRIGSRPMSIEELLKGPGNESAPSRKAKWKIIGAKSEGVAPGFVIRDTLTGKGYILKFNSLAYPEMATGSDVIGSAFFHALGYHVPENYLVTFDKSQLVIGEDTTIADAGGRRRPLSRRDVTEILLKVSRDAQGQIRGVASYLLKGKLLREFRYHGTRSDDPNDVVPHEHRRDLRGLFVFCAWLGHHDSRAINPGFPFWPPGHQRSYIQPPPLEPFLWFFHPERLQRPRKGPTLLLRVRKSLEVPHFKQFPRHLSVPFPPSPGLVPLRRRTLSGWHRQTLNPPHHASKQAPRQMALGQHQPVVTGMLHQPPARLHEPLLQARQRPVVDPLR